MTYIIKPNKECDYCEIKETNIKFSKCSACKCTYYCSKECQKKDWSIHKKICNNRSFTHEIKKLIQILFSDRVHYFTMAYVNTYNIVDLKKFTLNYKKSSTICSDIFGKIPKLETFIKKSKKVRLELTMKAMALNQHYIIMMEETLGIIGTPSTYEVWKEEINNFNILDKIANMDRAYIKRGKIILKIEDGILIDERNKEVNDNIDRINREYKDKFRDIIKYIEDNKRESSIRIDKVIPYLTDNYMEYYHIIDESTGYMVKYAEIII